MAEAPECSKPVDSGTSETLEADFQAVPACTGALDSGTKMGPPAAGSDQVVGSLSGDDAKNKSDFKAEIDTSAPFESVKEAATRFGGFGFWKPHNSKLSKAEQHDVEEVEVTMVEEQAAQLEKDLIVKEREALEVLKELETTKMTVEELKLKLQRGISEVDASIVRNSDDGHENLDMKEAEKEKYENAEVDTSAVRNSDDRCENLEMKEAEEEKYENVKGGHQNSPKGMGWCPSSAPGLILMELKQAKLNLTRTTNDLADIRASIELYNKKVEKERISLEKTRQRLISSSSKISCLEEQLNQTRIKLHAAKYAEINGISDDPLNISRELQQLTSEVEKFKKMGEVAKSEVLRAMLEIEETRTRIKTAEIRLVAAKKMKEAARAAEFVALAEIKALSNSESLSGVLSQKPEVVTLSFEEYSSLASRAREAEEHSKKRVVDAMLQVDDANVSKMEILKRVEDAKEVVKTSRKALEVALSRVEVANRGKLRVEDSLRKWRAEHGQRRRSSVHNSTKFKNPHPSHSHCRRDSHLFDVNGLDLVSDEAMPVLRPTLSIGQILSRKLLLTEEFGTAAQAGRSSVRRKVSLGQMLDKNSGDELPASRRDMGDSGHKLFRAKRKKLGFAKLSTILTKQSKKKKPTPNLK